MGKCNLGIPGILGSKFVMCLTLSPKAGQSNPRQKKGGYYRCTLVLLILWGARAQVEDDPGDEDDPGQAYGPAQSILQQLAQ